MNGVLVALAIGAVLGLVIGLVSISVIHWRVWGHPRFWERP